MISLCKDKTQKTQDLRHKKKVMMTKYQFKKILIAEIPQKVAIIFYQSNLQISLNLSLPKPLRNSWKILLYLTSDAMLLEMTFK